MSFQAYLDNIQKKTGKTAEDFKQLASKKGLLQPATKAREIVAWLKKEFELGHGHAMAIYAFFKGFVPKEAALKKAAPKKAVPLKTAPGTGVPKKAVPGKATPKKDLSKITAPQITAPKKAVSKKPIDSGFETLAKPAQRALEGAGISSLKQLAKLTESEVSALHGIGKNAVLELKKLLEQQDLDFKKEK